MATIKLLIVPSLEPSVGILEIIIFLNIRGCFDNGVRHGLMVIQKMNATEMAADSVLVLL